jgi:acyl-CoA reductase-like NAD-dependent aldehyde dehydrogenase
VLTGVDHSMAIMRDESFGPVIGIQVVGDDAEAVAQMVDTEYGLTAGVTGAAPNASSSASTRARCTGTAATASAPACRGPVAVTPASA